MPFIAKHAQLRSRRSTLHIHVAIFIAIFLTHVGIFRVPLFATPDIVSGRAVIARDELVPFFDFNTQFFSQMRGGISPLTSSEEIRISYSFLTAWSRYYIFLPIALIIFSSATCFLLYVSFYLSALTVLGGRETLAPKQLEYIIASSLISASFFHLILLQAKVTHFYELMFGFGLFSLSISLLHRLLFSDYRTRYYPSIFLICALVVINPAVHFHFLFLLILILFTVLLPLGATSRDDAVSRLLAVSIVFCLSTIPYMFLILYIALHSNVHDAISLTYATILNSSVSLGNLVSLDIASPYDMYARGVYLPLPQFTKAIFFVAPIAGFIYTLKKRLASRVQIVRMLPIAAMLLLGIWFSVGYIYDWSGQRFLGYLAINAAHFPGGRILQKIVESFLQILRYPHRFEFIFFYAVGSLATISMAFVVQNPTKLKHSQIFIASFLLTVALPLMFLPSYSTAFFTGNFGGFLQPYPIPPELPQIKRILSEDRGVAIVLPSLETGRTLGVFDFNFLDKFLIYYCNSPFLYYGSSSSSENKAKVFAAYEVMLNGEQWWDKYLANVLRIKYIILPHTQSRSHGNTFLPQIDEAILRRLETSPIYARVVQGDEYDLFAATSSLDSHADSAVLIDESLADIGPAIRSSSFVRSRPFLPLDAELFAGTSTKSKYVLTHRPGTAYMDILDAVYPEVRRYVPDDSFAPFDSSYISSNEYFYLPLTIAALRSSFQNKTGLSINNFSMLIRANFLASKSSDIAFKGVSIPDEGAYFALQAVAASSTNIYLYIDNDPAIRLSPLSSSTSTKGEFNYYVSTKSRNRVFAKAVTVRIHSDGPLAIESLVVVPVDYYFVPLSSDDFGSPLLRFRPVPNSTNLYRIAYLCESVYKCN